MASPNHIMVISYIWNCFVKVVREMEDVLICLVADERVCQIIGIMVVDIPEAYGLILSQYWSVKLDGYFATYWSHLWFPYQCCHNQIKVMRDCI